HHASTSLKFAPNGLYGKLGARPERTEVMYSRDDPGEGWYSAIDQQGERIPDLWSRQVETYRPTQQVWIASQITARVRGRLYQTMAQLAERDITVYAAHVDSLTLGEQPDPGLVRYGGTPGAWRVVGAEIEAVIRSPS